MIASYLRLLTFCLFGLIFFTFSACTGGLDGFIFLDEDGDNKFDEDTEMKIANLEFSVSKDEEEIETAQTDIDGHFNVDLKGSGEYCVEVDSSDLSATNDDGTSPSLAALIRQTTVPFAMTSKTRFQTASEDDCDDGADDDADGSIDCADSDCSSDTACVESDCSDEEDNDDDGATDCEDSDCTSDADCEDSEDTGDDETTSDDDEESEAVTESGLACDSSSGIGLTLEVPVAKDYSSGVGALDDPDDNVVSRGETFTIRIQYPSSCEFDTGFYLSSSLTPLNVPASSYDSATGQLDLNEVVDAASTLTVSDPLSISDDSITTYDLLLCTGLFSGGACVSDGSLAARTIELTPSVNCPDDQSVDLKTHTVEIDSADDIEVTQSMSGSQTHGGTITITTTVTNNSSVSYTASEVELTLQSPALTTSHSYSASCSNAGQNAVCSFALAADSSVNITSSFVLPATLGAATNFEATAELELTSGGTTATFEADPAVEFSLACSPTCT